MMMNQKIEISDYYSDDGTKKAIVFKQDRGYGIDFYENEKYTHSTLHSYEDKSLHFVEDAAENFVLGHFKNYRDFR